MKISDTIKNRKYKKDFVFYIYNAKENKVKPFYDYYSVSSSSLSFTIFSLICIFPILTSFVVVTFSLLPLILSTFPFGYFL
jgi:hypothetical protein